MFRIHKLNDSRQYDPDPDPASIADWFVIMIRIHYLNDSRQYDLVPDPASIAD